MKKTLGLVSLTTAALLICLEAVSVAANNQPNLSYGSTQNVHLLAQARRFPRQGLGQRAIRVPIETRSGGIPVIAVTFNGRRKYPMLVDTGASITTITPEMARALRFRQEDKIELTVANGQRVQVPVGRVPSIEIGGLVINDFPVAVSSAPLLGQNFYSQFNILIGQDFVVFRPRLR